MGGLARVQMKEIARFNRRWEDLYEEFPAARAAAVAAMGKAVKEELDARILGLGLDELDDMFGHIRSTQRVALGSGGGYAAVRPVAEPMTDRWGKAKTWRGKQVSTRQVTKWLERGHGARKPSGLAKRYRPRIKRAGVGARGNVYVKARQFYSATRLRAWDRARKAAENTLSEIADKIDY